MVVVLLASPVGTPADGEQAPSQPERVTTEPPWPLNMGKLATVATVSLALAVAAPCNAPELVPSASALDALNAISSHAGVVPGFRFRRVAQCRARPCHVMVDYLVSRCPRQPAVATSCPDIKRDVPHGSNGQEAVCQSNAIAADSPAAKLHTTLQAAPT